MKPDWKDAPDGAKWLAMDVNHNWWWYTSKPYFSETEGCWLRDSGLAVPAYLHNNSEEAEDSLEKRPTTATLERAGVMQNITSADIRKFGYEAYVCGKDVTETPFQPGTDAHTQWADGWHEADFEIDWEA